MSSPGKLFYTGRAPEVYVSSMSARATALFRPDRLRLGITYTLSLGEFVLELMYPFTIGLAIDGFLGGRGFTSIIPLAAVWGAQSAVGALYQISASRTVARIYRRVCGDLVLQGDRTPDATSEVAARVNMVEKVCEALSDVVPMLLSAFVTIAGSTIMLFLFDVRAGLVALSLILIIGLLQWWFSVHALDLNGKINTLRESQVTVLRATGATRVRDYLRALTRLNVRFKDLETGVWTIADVFALLAIAVVLYLVAGAGAYNAGAIYAMVTYIMSLTDSLESAPVLVDEAAHFSDVVSRVASGAGSLES